MYFLTFTCLTTFHCAPNPAGTPGGSFGVPSVGQFSKVLVVHFWQLPNATRGAPLVIVKVRWLIGEPWYTLSTLPIANTSRQSSPLLKWAAWSICCYLPKEGICYLIYQKVVQLAGQTNHKRVPPPPPPLPLVLKVAGSIPSQGRRRCWWGNKVRSVSRFRRPIKGSIGGQSIWGIWDRVKSSILPLKFVMENNSTFITLHCLVRQAYIKFL